MPKKKKDLEKDLDMKDEEKDPLEKMDEEEDEDFDPKKLKSTGFHIEEAPEEDGLTDDLEDPFIVDDELIEDDFEDEFGDDDEW